MSAKSVTFFRLYLFFRQDNQERIGFGVCLKGLSFPADDLSLKIMEWIETLKSLGAKRIFMYDLAIHENTRKIIDYYVKVSECWAKDIYPVQEVPL